MSAVSVRGLWHGYRQRPILENVNFSCDAGAFCSIVGESGCGKSTFLRLLMSQETPERGAILIDGRPLAPEPGPDRGVVFQRYSVFPHLTVLGNLTLGEELSRAPVLGRLFGAARRRAQESAREMLDSIGLAHVAGHYPAMLSGGMQQRLAIAQAMLRKPRILLLDEPFGALDPGTRSQMHGLLTKLWRGTGMTVFMVTHDIAEGFALGTRLLVFDKVRHDPQSPDAYGATITYDLSIGPKAGPPADPPPDRAGQPRPKDRRASRQVEETCS